MRIIDLWLDMLRADYDRVASAYTDRFSNELHDKPIDRRLLRRFARQVKGTGQVLDLGCGPGHIARYLADRGTSVCGIDLAPKMVALAARRNPDIVFSVGNMTALDFPDGSVAGLLAFYSIVNFPLDVLDLVFAEMFRVLRPNGRLLLSFHMGDGIIHIEELLGQRVSMDFFLFQPSAVTEKLRAAGLHVDEVVQREPYAPAVEYQSRRAYVFARR
jgi:SAM-dependent methyltransferase